jgi:hypothetical protein
MADTNNTNEAVVEQAQQGVVDSSPINTLERRNSLEKHLQTRPEEQDLKNRHILLDTTAAPALQAKAQELERQRITDNLKKVSFSSSAGL